MQQSWEQVFQNAQRPHTQERFGLLARQNPGITYMLSISTPRQQVLPYQVAVKPSKIRNKYSGSLGVDRDTVNIYSSLIDKSHRDSESSIYKRLTFCLIIVTTRNITRIQYNCGQSYLEHTNFQQICHSRSHLHTPSSLLSVIPEQVITLNSRSS